MSLINSKIEKTFVSAFKSELKLSHDPLQDAGIVAITYVFSGNTSILWRTEVGRGCLNDFTNDCKEGGGRSKNEGRMAENDFAISPSCCYHCYEGYEGWDLGAPDVARRDDVGCHRYEGANHKTMSRLRSFNMREIVWVGQPRYVIE